jgi:hypothetical protein
LHRGGDLLLKREVALCPQVTQAGLDPSGAGSAVGCRGAANAEGLQAQAPELFAGQPSIEYADVLAAKLP